MFPNIFSLGFVIYWFHTNLSPTTFYNKIAPMAISTQQYNTFQSTKLKTNSTGWAKDGQSSHNPLTTARANLLARNFWAINRQLLELETCSNPLRIQQVFQSKSKKTIFGFGGRFSGGDVTKRTCFGNFSHLLPVLGPNALTQRLRVAYNFGCRALYNLPWRASVSSHQVQCKIPTFEALLRKYKYLFLERCRKSNNVWLRALMQSDCLYSSLFFEHYNRILLCD